MTTQTEASTTNLELFAASPDRAIQESFAVHMIHHPRPPVPRHQKAVFSFKRRANLLSLARDVPPSCDSPVRMLMMKRLRAMLEWIPRSSAYTMDDEADIIFGGAQNGITMSVMRRTHTGCTDYWDGNWLTTDVRVAIGGFRGRVDCDLRAEEFLKFRDDLIRITSRSEARRLLPRWKDG
jgi:hypothetical protein